MTAIRAAFVCVGDANDVGYWSGIPYFMLRGLREAGFDVKLVSPLPGPRESLLTAPTGAAIRLRQLYHRKVKRKWYEAQRDPAMIKLYARQVLHRLGNWPADVIIAPSTIPLAGLQGGPPKVFWADATYAGFIDCYVSSAEIAAPTLHHGHQAERAGLANASAAVYASEWAARTAVDSYGADPERVHAIPFGANLDDPPPTERVEQWIAERPVSPCRLLFLGQDWPRKGGDKAVEVARRLNNDGIRTILTVVGPRAQPMPELPSFVKYEGFVQKSTVQGRAKLEQVLADSTFLILPTRAEFFGCVFAEASAYGVPSLSTRVGGVRSAVVDGVNGSTFPLDSDASKWAAYIADLLRNTDDYRDLCRSARRLYEDRLNWGTACRNLRRVCESLLPSS